MDRATPNLKRRPRVIAIHKDASLIQNAIQQERRDILDPVEMRDVDTATGDLPETYRQVGPWARAPLCERNQQIEVGARVLIPSRYRPVQHRQPDAPLGA
jgi:hypothetical protein